MAQPTDASLDPAAQYVNQSCFDLLLIELLPLAERMARDYEASLDRPSLVNRTSKPQNAPSIAGTAATAVAADGLPETELFKETRYYRLESLGYRVGQGLSERFSRDRPRFTDQLDMIKFICKDLWTVAFKKQIDNLKTNHRVDDLASLNPHMLIGPGRLCFDRQQIQTFDENEHDLQCRGRVTCTTSFDLSMRHHSRSTFKSGNDSYRAG